VVVEAREQLHLTRVEAVRGVRVAQAAHRCVAENGEQQAGTRLARFGGAGRSVGSTGRRR
jgi:hypothetical protein